MNIVRSNQIYVPLKGFSGKVLAHLKRIASFKNPEFYAKQGMRLSTYNIPRVICCAEVLDDYLALPRGCEDAVLEFQGIFSGENYQASLVEHRSHAQHSIIIAAMKISLKRRSQLWLALKEAMLQGVQVVVFVKHKNEQAEWLQREGLTVRVANSLMLQLVVIDKKGIWYGGINFMGYATEEDYAIRLSDAHLAAEMIEVLYGE